MTIFRFSLLLLLVAGLAGGLFYARQEHLRQERFAKVIEFAKECDFPIQRVTLDDEDRDAAVGQVSFGGIYLDCSTNAENAPLACLEGKMKKAHFAYRLPRTRGNCTFVPPVP